MLPSSDSVRSNLPRSPLRHTGRLLLAGGQLVNDLLPQPNDTCARGAYALQKLCQALCKAHGIEVTCTGRLPLGPKILVSNHLGYIDPVAIASQVPCAPIAKSDVASWPLVGKIATRYNTLFVQRGNPYSGAVTLRRAARILEGGASVLNFPEGTTTSGRTRPFSQGIFGLSALARVAVVPLAISFEDPSLCWVDDQTFVAHYLQSLRNKPHRVRLRVGPSLWYEDFATATQMAAAAREWIISNTHAPAEQVARAM